MTLNRISAACFLVATLGVLAGCAGRGQKPVPVSQSLLAEGARNEASGDLDGALVQYVQALGAEEAGGTAAETHFRIGRVHAKLGNVATAREAFQRALLVQADHAGALEGLGVLQLESGDRVQASALLKKAIEKNPSLWRADNGLGVIADLDGDHALAQSYFNKVLAARPNEVSAINNLGYSYYLEGETAKARAQFERAITLDPNGHKGWSNLALVQAREGDYVHAVSSLERVMSAPEARYSIGYLCLREGKLTEARWLLEEAIRRSDHYEPAAQAALKQIRDELARSKRPGGPPR